MRKVEIFLECRRNKNLDRNLEKYDKTQNGKILFEKHSTYLYQKSNEI